MGGRAAELEGEGEGKGEASLLGSDGTCTCSVSLAPRPYSHTQPLTLQAARCLPHELWALAAQGLDQQSRCRAHPHARHQQSVWHAHREQDSYERLRLGQGWHLERGLRGCSRSCSCDLAVEHLQAGHGGLPGLLVGCAAGVPCLLIVCQLHGMPTDESGLISASARLRFFRYMRLYCNLCSRTRLVGSWDEPITSLQGPVQVGNAFGMPHCNTAWHEDNVLPPLGSCGIEHWGYLLGGLGLELLSPLSSCCLLSLQLCGLQTICIWLRVMVVGTLPMPSRLSW